MPSGAIFLAALSSGPAHALSWSFTASFAGSFSGTATGTAITDGAAAVIGNTYTINSITGSLTSPTLGSNLPISGPINYQSATNTFTYNGPGPSIFAAGATGISWSFPYSIYTVKTNIYNSSGAGNVNAWRTDLFGQAGTIASSSITPVPTPGPLPLFGAGAAFGWSRRLRRRLKPSGAALAVTATTQSPD